MGATCFTWSKTFSGVEANPAAAMPWAFGGAIVGLIAAIAICFKHTWAPMLAPFYALAEGLFLGGVSANQPLHAGPGITNDLPERLKTHAAGQASKYTRSRLPVRLAYSESQKSKSTALKREAAIKRLRRAEKEQLTKPKPRARHGSRR